MEIYKNNLIKQKLTEYITQYDNDGYTKEELIDEIILLNEIKDIPSLENPPLINSSFETPNNLSKELEDKIDSWNDGGCSTGLNND